MSMTKLGRRQFLGTAAAAAAVTMGAPLVARADTATLNITGWGGKWGEIFAAQIAPVFEKEFNCKLVTDTSFPFLPKLQASSRSNPIYDVLHANTNEHWKALEFGLIDETLDAQLIPNLADLYDFATSDKMVGVAMYTSAIGLAYRSDRLSAAPKSWKEFWNPEYADKRGAYVIPINSFGQAFLYLSGGLFGSDYKDLDAAYEAMEKLKPVKLQDFTGGMEKLLLSGEVDIAVLHDSGALRYYDTEHPIRFAAPEEGLLSLEQTLSITKGTKKRELANAFVNFMLSPEIQKILAEGVWYSPANKKVDLAPVYKERLLATPEKMSSLIQVDWKWYNANKDAIDMRVNRIFRA